MPEAPFFVQIDTTLYRTQTRSHPRFQRFYPLFNRTLLALLVYRKNLRKGTEDYTASTPPHVAAARKSTQPLSRSISYVMTTAGPEPIGEVRHPLDRQHYVLKQIKPVAEPVLATLGLEFDRVVGDNRQLELYALPSSV